MSILIAIIGGYLLILCLMYIFQRYLIFLPSSDLMITPDQAGLQAQDLWMDTEDGERLHGWIFPKEEAEYIIILSHGNAGNISGRIDIAKFLNELGLAVILYDYRGYGKSSGKPSEEGMYLDVEAVANFVKTEIGYSEKQMIMYGRSLGGAVASFAATRFNVGGLVLDSTFRNLKLMVKDLYPFVPASLARYEFSTESYLKQVSVPVMIMHSPKDEIADISQGKYLYDLAEKPKKFVELRGGHNENFHASTDILRESWKEFLRIIVDYQNIQAKKID